MHQSNRWILPVSSFRTTVQFYRTLFLPFLLSRSRFRLSTVHLLMQLICTILYVLFIIHLLINEFRSFKRLQHRYFLQFWSLIEMGVIVCSCVSIGAYVWRYKESNRLAYSLCTKQQLCLHQASILWIIFLFDLRHDRFIRFVHILVFRFIQTLPFATGELLSFESFLLFEAQLRCSSKSVWWSSTQVVIGAPVRSRPSCFRFDTPFHEQISIAFEATSIR